MKIISLSSKLAHLEAADERVFRGYASVFYNVNSYGFAMERGAFDKVLEEGQVPAMFFNHNVDQVPIGTWKALEVDDIGLKVEGVLTPGIQLADDVYAAIRAGSVSGMSIGFDVAEDGIEEGTGFINRVDHLYEISVCTFPADGKARISEALSAELEAQISSCSKEQDFEDFLRDVGGLSRSRAKQFIAQFKASLKDQRDADLKKLEEDRFAEELKKLMAKNITF